MRERYSKLNIAITICVLTALLIAVVVSVVTIPVGNDINSEIKVANNIDFSEKWKTESDITVNINSYTIKKDSLSTDTPYILRKSIDRAEESETLYIHSRNAVINVYINNNPVHITAVNGKVKDLTEFENFIFVSIPGNFVQKNIRLDIYRTDCLSELFVDEVILGSGNDIMKDLMLKSTVSVVISVLLIVISVVLLIYGISTRKKLDSSLSNVYFSVFILLMSVAVLFDTPWAHIILNNPIFTEKCFKIIVIASTPAFIAFIDSFIETEHYFPVKILAIVSSLIVPLFCLLDAFNVIGFDFLGIVWGVFLVVAGIVMTVETAMFLSNSRGTLSPYKKLPYIFLYIFEGLVILDLVLYLQRTSGYDDLFFTRIGLLFMSAVTGIARFREILDMIKLGVQAGKIGKIAFTDANTGIGNVAAFRAKFDELESQRTNYKYIAVIQFDVNNLKLINDSKGHEAGDLLIKRAAGIINQAFGNIGDCYRTGGDEFVALITSEHAPIVCEEAIYKFNRAIDKFNDDPEKPFDLRIALGVAYYRSGSGDSDGTSLKDVHKIADERMYNNKKMLKARYARSPEEAEVR